MAWSNSTSHQKKEYTILTAIFPYKPRLSGYLPWNKGFWCKGLQVQCPSWCRL